MYGLALMGGGARGAAHLGVLRALVEADLAPDFISGTSAGSMVAATYAWRGKVADVERLFEQLQALGPRVLDLNILGLIGSIITWISQRNLTFTGVFRGERLERLVAAATEGASLSDVRVPLAIPAVDLNRGEVYMFASRPAILKGPETWQMDATLALAVRASSALPVLFCPPTDGDAMLVDGGVLENLPAGALRRMGVGRILGVVLDSAGGPPAPPDDIVGIAQRSIEAMQKRLNRIEKHIADHVIHVVLPAESGVFSFENLDEFVQIGYETARAALPALTAFIRPGLTRTGDGGLGAKAVSAMRTRVVTRT